MNEINGSGVRAAAPYPDLMYWDTTGAKLVARSV
jgi:hypothetical protein